MYDERTTPDLRADRYALDRIMGKQNRGTVVRVHPDASVSPAPGVLPPDLVTGTDGDGSIMAKHEAQLIEDAEALGWELMTGWSHQNSGRYNGPTMHASEFIGGPLVRFILDTPGLWVAIEQATDDGAEPEGWLLLHRPDPTLALLPDDAIPSKVRLAGISYQSPLRGEVTGVDADDSMHVMWEDGTVSVEQLVDRGSEWVADSAEPFCDHPNGFEFGRCACGASAPDDD